MLNWCNAKTQAHRGHLSVFRCTDPANAEFDEEQGYIHHTAPWEFEVQDHINGLHPPAHKPEFLLLGYDDEGLAAVIELRVYELDRHCFIAAVAVAHRASGRGHAGEAIDLVHRVMPKYGINDDYVVEALIDPDNWAAKSVFKGRGYKPIDMRNGYEVWARKF